MRTKLACSPTRGTHRPLITPSTPNKLYITSQLPTPSLFVSFSNHFHHYQKLNYKSLLLPRLSCFLFTNFSLNTHVRKSMSAGIFSASIARSGCVGLKANSSQLFPVKDSISWTRKTISNGSKTHCMKTWNPIDNKKFETLSYLPPLTDESIAKEIDYMLKKGWIPCLEFDAVGHVYRENSRIPGYYDGRYWTLWKLPMFGCNDSSQVLHEIHECKKAYPNAYIRCLAFDNKHQGQCMAFVIQKPTTPF